MGLTDAFATWAGPPLPAFVEDLSLQRPGMGLVAIQCAEKGERPLQGAVVLLRQDRPFVLARVLLQDFGTQVSQLLSLIHI